MLACFYFFSIFFLHSMFHKSLFFGEKRGMGGVWVGWGVKGISFLGFSNISNVFKVFKDQLYAFAMSLANY